MLAATAVSKLAAPARTSLVQATRQMNIISAPPSVRISFAEKVCHGLFIAVGMLAVPAWVMVNIKNYKSKE